MSDPYFSEIKYLGGRDLDFIEVAVDPGTDVSDLVMTVYFDDGTVRSSNSLEDLTPTQSGGKDIYVIDTTTSDTFDGLGKTNGMSLSDGSDVYAFVSFDNKPDPVTAVEGPAAGLTSTQIGRAEGGESLETSDEGNSYQVQTDPNPGTIPCLTMGTRVRTPDGPIAVEDLSPGQLVSTLDRGPVPLVMVLRKTVSADELQANPKLRPVRIGAGALGPERPLRDLSVSRQHRMLVISRIAKRMFSVPSVLIAAVHLVRLPGVSIDRTCREVTYFHLLFQRHEVIFAEECPTESLFLGPEALKSLPADARDEVSALFPEAVRGSVCPGRFIPTGPKQKRLVSRHVANRKPLLQETATSG